MSDVNNLLENAVMETKKVLPGEEFLLRDLFKEYEWNRISRSDRLLLGTLFLSKRQILRLPLNLTPLL